MAYPSDLPTVTVRHRPTGTDGTAARGGGKVTAVLTGRLWTGQGSVVPTQYTVDMAPDGSYEFEFVPVDHPDIVAGKGEAYLITEPAPTIDTRRPGRVAVQQFHVAPVTEMVGQTVDVSDVLVNRPKPGGGVERVTITGPATDESLAGIIADPSSQTAVTLKDTIATEVEAPARAAATEYLAEHPEVADEAATRAVTVAADPAIAGALADPATASGQLFADKADLIRADRTVTVGPGGNYPTINAALETLSRGHTRYKSRGLLIEVRLLAGYVMAEQVLLGGGTNLGWIVITSDDPVVTVNRAALTVSATGDTTNYAAFAARHGSALPRLATIFEMDTSGAATERSGIYITGGSRAVFEFGAGFRNAARRNLDVHEYSIVVARGADFSGAGDVGARIGNGALAFLRGATITGCGAANVAADGATVHVSYATLTDSQGLGVSAVNSRVDASFSDVSGAATAGVESRRGSVVNFTNGTATDCGLRALWVHPESSVDATNATLTGNPEGVRVSGGSASLIDADISNTTGTALFALDAARVAANRVKVSGSGVGVEARTAAVVTVTAGVGTGCGEAITARSGSTIDASTFNGSGAGPGFGFRAIEGSRINASGANSRRGSTDNPNDTVVQSGAIINASGHTGGVYQAANTVTANGIIFK